MACCSSNTKCLPCFFYLALALFLVELRWPVTLLSLFLCLPFSLFSGFVDMTINLNLILYTIEYKNIFCFPFSSLLTLQLCLLHKTREAIHFPTKITWHLASAYKKWVYGRSAFVRYVITKFSCFHRLPIYLSNGVPPRALRAEAPL